MTKGYKCDWCTHFGEDKNEVKEHEENCSFNPIFKNCYSCNNQEYDYDDYDYGCGIRLGSWFEYEEKGNCPKWEGNIVDIRKEKLKRLKE